MIPKKLLNKMLEARNLINKHKDLVSEIDSEMESLGYNVDELRNSDDCGYVDMIDYGTGFIIQSSLEQFKG